MQRTSLTNLFALISLASIVASCGGEHEVSNPQVHTRLQFSSYDQYFSTLELLNSMSDAESMEWEANNHFYSLRMFSLEHGYPINLPQGISKKMSAVLNPDMEVKIGNTLVWVDGSHKYVVNDGDEMTLQALKREPDKWKTLSHVTRIEYDPNHVSYKRHDLAKVPNSGPIVNDFSASRRLPTFWWNGGEYQAQIWGYCDERDDGWGTVAKIGTSVTLNYCYKRYRWSDCSWRSAGENFRKQITGLTLDGTFPYLGAVKVGPLELLQVDNTELNRQLFEAFGLCWMFSGTLTGTYNLTIDGSTSGVSSTYTW